MAKVELKQPIVDEIKAQLDGAKSMVVVDYRGISVADVTELRKQCREAGVVYKVYKNTMVKRAVEGTEFEGVVKDLEGTNAFAISKDDATAPARIVANFIKKAKCCELKSGVVEGTYYDAAGIATIAYTQEALTGASHKKVGPRFIPKILGNIAAANIAIDYNIQGPSFTVSTACSSGGDAINTACMCMQSGKADIMLAVGAESVLCPLVIYSLANAKALSRRNDSPSTASRPFDVTRDGFVIGEGGGALVLETEEHALARGAKIYAEIRGCGNTNDAYHVTAPHPEGRGAIACMKQAIAEAGINPSDIGYINAHGTATNKGDTVETSSIKKVFGNTLPYVSSTKGATGHMMGAGGITETITCVKAIETGTVPPTINLNEVDPECAGIDFVANTAKKAEINFAMSNAFGFGGQNSSIIVGKYGK